MILRAPGGVRCRILGGQLVELCERDAALVRLLAAVVGEQFR